jgi:hypothetical protein
MLQKLILLLALATAANIGWANVTSSDSYNNGTNITDSNNQNSQNNQDSKLLSRMDKATSDAEKALADARYGKFAEHQDGQQLLDNQELFQRNDSSLFERNNQN